MILTDAEKETLRYLLTSGKEGHLALVAGEKEKLLVKLRNES